MSTYYSRTTLKKYLQLQALYNNDIRSFTSCRLSNNLFSQLTGRKSPKKNSISITIVSLVLPFVIA